MLFRACRCKIFSLPSGDVFQYFHAVSFVMHLVQKVSKNSCERILLWHRDSYFREFMQYILRHALLSIRQEKSALRVVLVSLLFIFFNMAINSSSLANPFHSNLSLNVTQEVEIFVCLKKYFA